MSFGTRTAQVGFSKPQDENPQFVAKNAKTGTAQTTRRTAAPLGDITNVTGLSNAGQANQKGNGRVTRSTAPNSRPAPVQQQFFQQSISEGAMMVDEPVQTVSLVSEAMQVSQTWTDIDELDHQDPQAVTEYVDEIYVNCRQKEMLYTVTHDYMAESQNEISAKMRYILIDWLCEVHLKFKLLPETMGLTVNLVDRFLSKYRIARDALQLVGVTCMFIAAKYEEIYPPECNDFVYISGSAYTREQVLRMEGIVLNTVEFNLTVPTSLHFLRRYSKAASSDYPTHTLCKYFLELSMVDMRMNQYYPSAIAAAAVYLARIMTFGEADWHSTLEHYTQYDEATVYPIAKDLLQVARDALTASHQAVVRKYQNRKFGEVARRALPPSI